MTDQGAITLAIEALDLAAEDYSDRHSDTFPPLIKCEKALEALKAFKDGVPDGLESFISSVKNSIETHKNCVNTSSPNYEETTYDRWLKKQSVGQEAEKHLQEGIK